MRRKKNKSQGNHTLLNDITWMVLVGICLILLIVGTGTTIHVTEDKHIAIIHDLVVAPEINSSQENFNMERSLIKGELKRVHDFAVLSENADFAYNELDEILSYYNISLF